ncbi:MAG: type II toxin-antitoxin system HigB family toxin [Bacteroidia bacterium]|nr:type II toxin-antitoxin system HigB family toxin [Bacteroidia bacterium]
MKVHLIRKQTIELFAIRHSNSKSSFVLWLNTLKYADWKIPEDIQATYGSADLLGRGSNRVVFNIGGNNYRMICKYGFGNRVVHLFIMWIGTHAEYTRLCSNNEQFTVSAY